MSDTKKQPRRCKVYYQPERSDGLYTIIAPYWGICVDCINRYVIGNSEHHERKGGAER